MDRLRSAGLILVADDDPGVRFRAQAVLGRRGDHVVVAADGRHACRVFRAHVPDIVLLGTDLRGLDGYAVCSQLCQEWGEDAPPILLMPPWGDDAAIARAYTAGATDVVPTPVSWRMVYERVQLLLEAKQTTDSLRRLAHHDTLTNLPNRALFCARLHEAIRLAREMETMVAVIFVDLDQFKAINDTYGHQVGDTVLRATADRLQRGLRTDDRAIPQTTDFVSRFGGDEFTILAADLPDAGTAIALVHRLQAVFAEPFHVEDRTVRVSASIGVSLYPTHGTEPDALLAHADAAMYGSKRRDRLSRPGPVAE